MAKEPKYPVMFIICNDPDIKAYLNIKYPDLEDKTLKDVMKISLLPCTYKGSLVEDEAENNNLDKAEKEAWIRLGTSNSHININVFIEMLLSLMVFPHLFQR